ncbi:hypothetical protein Pmani_029882, partial [Petrolisthes manimaculis]
MATGGVWTYYKQLIVCILVVLCTSHVSSSSWGRRVPVRIEAVFTPEINHILLLEHERTPVLVSGEETEVEVWGSGLSRGVEAGLTAAQGVQGAPCRSLITPPLTRNYNNNNKHPLSTTSHNYAVFTVPAEYTAEIVGVGGDNFNNQELWLCTRDQQHPQYYNNGGVVGVGGVVRARHGGWIHQGPDSRLVLVHRPQPSAHKLSLRSVERPPHSNVPLLTTLSPHALTTQGGSEGEPTKPPLTTTSLLADSEDPPAITTTPAAAQMMRDFEGGVRDIFSVAGSRRGGEAVIPRTEGSDTSFDPHDRMLGDMPSGGGDDDNVENTSASDTSRTPDKVNKEKSGEGRTSGGVGGVDGVADLKSGKDAVEISETLMNVMNDEAIITDDGGGGRVGGPGSGNNNGDSESTAPEDITTTTTTSPPAAQEGDPIQPSLSMIHVHGLRIEAHSKGVEYEDLAVSLLVNSEAKVRLFGEGMSSEMEVLFTADAGDPSDPALGCTARLSKAFKVEEHGDGWATLTVILPSMSSDQRRDDPWLTLTSYNLLLPLWLQGCFIVVLLVLSGLFSGLNLGLMALDKTELKIVSNTGSNEERSYARAIEPVRSHGNFLLCTLLLGNVLVNSSLTILLDELSSGTHCCHRFHHWYCHLRRDYPTSYMFSSRSCHRCPDGVVVRVFMVITGPVAYPISKILDLVLGEEIGNTYDRERLKELIK